MGKVIDFAAELERRIKRQGMTHLQVAVRANMDESAVSRYKSGKRRVSPQTAVALAKALRDLGLLQAYCDCCPVSLALRGNGFYDDAA